MKNEQLQDAIGMVRDDYIQDAHGTRTATHKKRGIPMWGGLAAVLCLLFATTSVAYVSNWFGLRQLELTQKKDTIDVESGDPVKEEPTGIISLQGYAGSAEFKAIQEWNEFLATYDDGGALDRIGNGPSGFEDFAGGLYLVYTQEMADEMERIVNKYSLALHQQLDVINHNELVYRVGGEFLSGTHGKYWGYIYDDGTFATDGMAWINDLGIVDYQLYRAVKGSFDTVTLNVVDIEEFEQWQYVTSGEQTVLLALGSNKGLIFGDFADCFISVNVLAGTGGDGEWGGSMTKEGLEELADGFDFSVLKTVVKPDMRGDSEAE